MNLKPFFKEYHLTGLHFNILFALYFFTLGPVIKNAVLYGKQNIFLGLVGLFFYVAESKFIRIKTKFVIHRGNEYYLNVIRKQNPRTKQARIGNFIFYNILCRFVFRIVLMMGSMMFLGLFNPDVPEQPWYFGAIMMATVLFELYEFITYSMLTGVFVSVDDKPDAEQKFNLEMSEKYTKMMKSKRWYFRNEQLADLILFFYSCMVFTAIWDTIGTEIITGIEQAHSEGGTIYWAIFAMTLQYGTLCLFALLPIRMAYWVEEKTMTYGSKGKWKLFGTYLITCLALMLPTIIKIIELYG